MHRRGKVISRFTGCTAEKCLRGQQWDKSYEAASWSSLAVRRQRPAHTETERSITGANSVFHTLLFVNMKICTFFHARVNIHGKFCKHSTWNHWRQCLWVELGWNFHYGMGWKGNALFIDLSSLFIHYSVWIPWGKDKCILVRKATQNTLS